MKTEANYYDKNGHEIQEFDLVKFPHFIGVGMNGRGRKRYYMYKWVRLVESDDQLYWAGLHLENASDSSFWLKSMADKDRRIDCEIIQTNRLYWEVKP